MESQRFAGIDAGKDEAVLAFSDQNRTLTFSTNENGLQQMLEEVRNMQPNLILVEASGGCEIVLCQRLMEHGFAVARVNPADARNFARSQGVRAKTDRVDALILARFAASRPFEPLQPKEQEREALRSLVVRRRQLKDMLRMEKQRRSAAEPAFVEDLNAHIEFLEEKIHRIEQKMAELIQRSENLREDAELLQAIPGVGLATVATILAEMPELGKANRQQVAALAGLAPFNNDSGKRQGKRRIFGGRAHVRSCLYMAALSASRFNPRIREFYRRLSQQKPAKVALIACARKLLSIMNTILKSREPFDRSHLPVTAQA